jgi:hypothetical protein
MIDVNNMTIEQLRDLSEAIKAEARSRARLASEIAGQKRQYVKTLPSGRRGAFSPDQFRNCAARGMTAREAADEIGCHVSWVYGAEKRLGLSFVRGKRGRKQK